MKFQYGERTLVHTCIMFVNVVVHITFVASSKSH